MKTKVELTQEKLKESLVYDLHTGVFTLRVSGHGGEIGDMAKCVSDRGYLSIRVCNKPYRAHRLAWLYVHGEWPKDQIDHINHVRDDNRLVNLRETTHQENHKNKTLSESNTSGVCGVCWHKRDSRWGASIKINRKDIHLVLSKDKFEAICARKSAENKYGFHPNHGQPKQVSIVLDTH